jgi:hypothetical protein
VFRECEKEALRMMRISIKNGLPEWAQLHCAYLFGRARYHRAEAKRKDAPRELRNRYFDRAVGECLQVTEICKSHLLPEIRKIQLKLPT